MLEYEGMQPDLVKIPRREHERLRHIEASFESLQKIFFSTTEFIQPPIKDPAKIIGEMKKTKRYSSVFLKSLERGLKESAYFRF